jgi:hypothetical protein
MFNESFILQFFLYLCLLFFFLNLDNFFMLVNSIIYLILVSVYAWNEDIDILINFLIIIDLGLFFIFFAFLIHNTNLFSYTIKKNIIIKVLFTVMLLVILYYYLHHNYFFLLKYSNLINFLYSYNYYNYFNIFNLIFFTDLQLLTELYFVYNFLEFIIMNFYMYIAIIAVYYLINFTTLLESFNFDSILFKKYRVNTLFFNEFFKTQNMQKQINTSVSTRVWLKKKTLVSDTKTNLN